MSNWSIESLKEYFDCILNERDAKVCQRFDDMQMAVTKAENASNERADKSNEFRGQLDDQAKTFARKELVDAEFKSIRSQLDEVKEKLQKIENIKQGGNIVWAYVLSAVSLITAIVALSTKILK